MTKDNMTIRFAPDGFSFLDFPDATSTQLDEAPFHEVTPGPDFQQRLHEAVLEALPESETPLDLTVQIHSSRVVVLPPDTEFELAASMYRTTFTEAPESEQVILQPLTLPTGQQVALCFGIDRSLHLFLQRNFGELQFEHHLATLLLEGARAANGNALVVRTDEQFLQVELFRFGQVSLVNVYRTSQADNRQYYVLNTWIREGLDQLNDNLLILGHSNVAQQLFDALSPFIKHSLQQ